MFHKTNNTIYLDHPAGVQWTTLHYLGIYCTPLDGPVDILMLELCLVFSCYSTKLEHIYIYYILFNASNVLVPGFPWHKTWVAKPRNASWLDSRLEPDAPAVHLSLCSLPVVSRRLSQTFKQYGLLRRHHSRFTCKTTYILRVLSGAARPVMAIKQARL